MDLSEEWKSMFPISSVFSAPLLLSSPFKSHPNFGPLIFNPSPQTLTLLLSSPSLSPLLPPPYPHLSLPRFLSTSPSPTHPSSLLPSSSSSVSTSLGGSQFTPLSSYCRHNRLNLLRCPGTNSLLVFFPTGDNSDRIGFLSLSVENSKLKTNGVLNTTTASNNHRILSLLVNPLSGDTTAIGYLMACTLYGVQWFSVKIKGLGSDSEEPVLDFVGSKLFKSCSVVNACWSPHLPEESVVLLESGELFLFDLDCCFDDGRSSMNGKFRGKRVWKGYSSLGKDGWLSCEFSWHPRIFIVAHSSAVFLVDLRPEGNNVSCLLKIDKLVMSTSVQNDRFVALSKVDSDRFYYVVASDRWLLLCDVRKPFMPLLQWAHDFANPTYINVFSMSELISNSKDDRFKEASELGYGIIVGSFWNCEFSLFCCGPPPGGTAASEISKFCKSFYAWELPSELSLSGRECQCGSCLLREEFSRDALPDWIDWRQKKEIVLGFGILDKDLHAELSELDGFGGFTLIRLMSSGKLESQGYCASWKFVEVSEEAHTQSSSHIEDSLLYVTGDGDYKFPKRFKYWKYDYLRAYMKGKLAKRLLTEMKKPSKGPCEKESCSADFHQYICQKSKACGSSSAVSDVLKDIRLVSSIHEVALKIIWAGLPMDLLKFAFSCYSEFLQVLVDHKKVSLEFLDLPSLPQLPPYVFRSPSCRSSKWSQKVQPGTAFVGPIIPTPFLLTVRKLRMEEEEEVLSDNTELSNQCNEVMQVVHQMAPTGSGSDFHNEYAVSLADDEVEPSFNTQKMNLLSFHNCKFYTMDPIPGNSVCNIKRFTSFISKKPQNKLVIDNRMEMVGPDLFNSVSPLELKFHDHKIKFGPNESKIFKLMSRQHSNFLQSFNRYQQLFEN